MRNLFPRLFFLALALVPLFFFNDFTTHFYAYIVSNVAAITHQWHIVAISILVFLAFLVPLSYRRKANWKELGLVTAFFVSLFVEMYGIPLTIIFASKYVFSQVGARPQDLFAFSFLGVQFGMDAAMAYGLVLMVVGGLLILLGWLTLYKNIKKTGLVTQGIYSCSRHPQYLGFILIVLGWFFGWPTILTLAFTPILVYKYLKVCLEEEKEMEKGFPEYKKYRARTPFLV